MNQFVGAPNNQHMVHKVVSIFYAGNFLNTYDVMQGGNGNNWWAANSQHILYLVLIEKNNTHELYRSEPAVLENATLLALEVGISNAGVSSFDFVK